MTRPVARHRFEYALWLAWSGLLGLPLILVKAKRQRKVSPWMATVALIVVLTVFCDLPACSGGSNGSGRGEGTPAGNYSLTVSGTFSPANLTQKVQLTLVVQLARSVRITRRVQQFVCGGSSEFYVPAGKEHGE